VNSILEAALDYTHRGFSPFPVGPDKKPLVPWTRFQTEQITEGEIHQLWAKWPAAMIGIPTGEQYGILVIDCDTPKGYETVQELLPDSLVMPVARTPRGGWHLWFKYPPGSNITIGAGLMPGVDFRGTGGYIIAPPSVNGNGRAYRWEHGLALGEVEPSTVPDALLKKISLYIGAGGGRPQETTKDHKYFHEGRRDEDLFRVANSLVITGCELPFIEQALKTLALNCIPPFSQKDAHAKIESAMKRAERRERNITAEIEEWVMTTEGHFKTTESHKELQMTTREEKKAAMMAFLRLKERGIIEKVGNAHGVYRRIDTNIEYMDFENADPGNTVDLSLPLGLHGKTKVFPKGAIVFAGVSGMGKTLMALNTIYDNRGKFPIFYFNSEMGPEALKKKLSYFPIRISEWVKAMKVVDGWDFHSIADKVQPDAFNVIDYLEPEGDKPYNIHGVISDIIRRLNKGTAIICVQKKPEAKMGTGGIYSIKAATFALALDWGKIEIVKNRFREEDPMPSLNKINFEVHRGWQIVPLGQWYK